MDTVKDLIAAVKMKDKDKEKINILHDFVPRSQYACTKCITLKRIVTIGDLHVGSHVCFERDMKFFHAILSDVAVDKSKESLVQMRIICKHRDFASILDKVFNHKNNQMHGNLASRQQDEIFQDDLPPVEVTAISLYTVEYGRKTYSKDKVLRRALAHVQYSCGHQVTLGSLSTQRIRPEAEFKYDTSETNSEHFATWCSTGESFSFDSKKYQKKIEYINRSHEISMKLILYKEEDSVQQLQESHQQYMLCDSCFLSELAKLLNEMEHPENCYRLVSTHDTAWINVRKIPNGLYRVKFRALNDRVLVRIKRYNSRIKRLALIIKIETFTFTLGHGLKCEEDCEVKYKFPYPFWKIPDSNDEKF